MEKKRKPPNAVTSEEQNKEYLHKIFTMFRDLEIAINAQRHERYSNTEIRLMNEIVYASAAGERLISTELASRLALTRSAISQIVNKLELEGMVRRVPDQVDRKIAYVELTEKSAAAYRDVVQQYSQFVGRVISYLGVAKMDRLLTLSEEFYSAVEKAVADCETNK